MRYIVLLLSCIIFIGFISLNAIAIEDDLAFEAEDFDTIQPPMKIMEDADVSGGAYIMSPQGRQGWIEYEIEIPDDADYYMWGMVQEQDGVSDSFFVTFDLLDRGEDDDQNVNSWDLDGPAAAWAWDKVSGRGMGGDPRVFALEKGKHMLRFWTREGNSYLDCVYMSTEQNSLPILASEFQGRDRITLPKAVTHADKLAAVWGRIKSPLCP